MCRSSDDGGRRCDSPSTGRSAATHRKRVSRARHGLARAIDSGDPDRITTARARLDALTGDVTPPAAPHPAATDHGGEHHTDPVPTAAGHGSDRAAGAADAAERAERKKRKKARQAAKAARRVTVVTDVTDVTGQQATTTIAHTAGVVVTGDADQTVTIGPGGWTSETTTPDGTTTRHSGPTGPGDPGKKAKRRKAKKDKTRGDRWSTISSDGAVTVITGNTGAIHTGTGMQINTTTGGPRRHPRHRRDVTGTRDPHPLGEVGHITAQHITRIDGHVGNVRLGDGRQINTTGGHVEIRSDGSVWIDGKPVEG